MLQKDQINRIGGNFWGNYWWPVVCGTVSLLTHIACRNNHFWPVCSFVWFLFVQIVSLMLKMPFLKKIKCWLVSLRFWIYFCVAIKWLIQFLILAGPPRKSGSQDRRINWLMMPSECLLRASKQMPQLTKKVEKQNYWKI